MARSEIELARGDSDIETDDCRGRTQATLKDEYRIAFPLGQALSQRAAAVIAGEAAHESWRFDPFPIYANRAEGAWKYSIEGRRIVDLWMGHGSLLLGHGVPSVVHAVREQAAKGTHLGGEHELEVMWAETICALVPSAERVRFTSSGTEATMLAMRIARAATGRSSIVRLDGHFHGWHDGAFAHLYDDRVGGISPGAAADVVLVASDDAEAMTQALETRDVAAVIVEPGGGSSGIVPCEPNYMRHIRELTDSTGTLLIFDEMVTGFRAAPGGVQQQLGVTPDLTCLGKIMTGGLPGAAVVGAGEIMDVLGDGGLVRGRVIHTGTFNANPLSAAAGIAMLEAVANGVPQRDARRQAIELADAANAVAARENVDIRLFPEGSSIVHVLIGGVREGVPAQPSLDAIRLASTHRAHHAALRTALLIEGVDSHPFHTWVSTALRDSALEETIAAYTRAFRRLRGWTGIEL